MRHETDLHVSETELAAVGAGSIAYMRRITGREIHAAFPGRVEIEPSAVVWALFAADGSPIALADHAGAALQSAFEHDLVPVAVH